MEPLSNISHPDRITLQRAITKHYGSICQQGDRAEPYASINHDTATAPCVLVPPQMKVFTAIGGFLNLLAMRQAAL